MDPQVIFEIISKGIAVVKILVEAGKDAKPAILALEELVTGAQNDTIDDATLDKTEALLDSMIDEFNQGT